MKILPLVNSSFQTMEHLINVQELGTWEWNIQTGIVRVNRFWYSMLGFDEAEPEMSMQLWQDMIHRDDIEPVMEAVQAHLAGHTPLYRSEFRLRSKEGGWVWIEAKGKVVEYGETRSPLYFCGTHTDITLRKTAGAAIEAAGTGYRFLYQNTGDCVLVLKSGLVAEANPAAAGLFGYENEKQLLTKHPAMLSPAVQPDGRESREKADAAIHAAATGEPQSFRWVFSRMNGDTFSADVHLQHIPAPEQDTVLALVRAEASA
jgi:two-component system sensor histidine kinase UhpB